MRDIHVQVEDDRVADFYRWFAAWLEGGVSAAGSGEHVSTAPQSRTAWTATAEDEELAGRLWRKSSPTAKALLAYLSEHPDERFSGEDLAVTLGIANGGHGVAGVLAWPGRRCYEYGKWLPVAFDESGYWMSAEVAGVFQAAVTRNAE